MKKIILTESEKKAILIAREKAIIESFGEVFNKIKRLDEGLSSNWYRSQKDILPKYNSDKLSFEEAIAVAESKFNRYHERHYINKSYHSGDYYNVTSDRRDETVACFIGSGRLFLSFEYAKAEAEREYMKDSSTTQYINKSRFEEDLYEVSKEKGEIGYNETVASFGSDGFVDYRGSQLEDDEDYEDDEETFRSEIGENSRIDENFNDLLVTLFSLIKYNNGEFKSEKQKNYILSKGNAEGNSLTQITNVSFGKSTAKNHSIAYEFFFDDIGFTKVLKQISGSGKKAEVYWEKSNKSKSNSINNKFSKFIHAERQKYIAIYKAKLDEFFNCIPINHRKYMYKTPDELIDTLMRHYETDYKSSNSSFYDVDKIKIDMEAANGDWLNTFQCMLHFLKVIPIQHPNDYLPQYQNPNGSLLPQYQSDEAKLMAMNTIDEAYCMSSEEAGKENLNELSPVGYIRSTLMTNFKI
jgi:hypothetical protein